MLEDLRNEIDHPISKSKKEYQQKTKDSSTSSKNVLVDNENFFQW